MADEDQDRLLNIADLQTIINSVPEELSAEVASICAGYILKNLDTLPANSRQALMDLAEAKV